MARKANGDESFASAVREALQETGASGRPKLLELVDVLIAKAVAGDIPAIREIADRLDGKAMQQMDVAVSNKSLVEMTDDELRAIASGAMLVPEEVE